MVKPENVISPKNRLTGPIEVLADFGPQLPGISREPGGAEERQGYSVARFTWDGNDAVGIRWNGTEEPNDIGTPQSRGIATWFILPGDIAKIVVEHIEANPPTPVREPASRKQAEGPTDLEERLGAVEGMLERLLEKLGDDQP